MSSISPLSELPSSCPSRRRLLRLFGPPRPPSAPPLRPSLPSSALAQLILVHLGGFLVLAGAGGTREAVDEVALRITSTKGRSGATLRTMSRAISSPLGCTITARSNVGAAAAGDTPRHAADHASMNCHKLWPSTTAWCTATPTATPPPPANCVTCTANTGAGSSLVSNLGMSRRNAGTSCSSFPASRRTSPSASASKKATPAPTADGEQSMTTSPEEGT